MNILIFLLLTVSPSSSAPAKDSYADLKKPDDVHSHPDAGREGLWNFNYAPGDITVQTVEEGGDFNIGHKADIHIGESSSKAQAQELSDCKYLYREVPSACRCRKVSNPSDVQTCATNQVCTVNKGCYNVCKPDSIIQERDYCYCKDESSGVLSSLDCGAGNMCTKDGHCHYAYQVSGLSTNASTASVISRLWTNQQYTISGGKIPKELINSLLISTEYPVAPETTIQISSPVTATTVYIAVDQDQDGGLMEQLEGEDNGWSRKGDWQIEYKEFNKPDTGVLNIWKKELDKDEECTLTTKADGAKFVLLFSTDCEQVDEIGRVPANCLCVGTEDSKDARTCKNGQGCSEGSCHDLPPLAGRR